MLSRPNALDRAVDAIPVHDLLTRSPLGLPDPARAAAADRLEQIRLMTWIAMVVLQIAILAWFWSAGLSAELRDRLRSMIRSEFAARFVFGALLALLDRLVALIPEAVQYRYSRIMDLTEMLFRTWLWHWIVATVLAMIVAGLIAAIVLWLADRTHQWYLYTIGAVIGFTLLVSYVTPYAIAPIYRTYAPLQAPALARDVASLERRTGIDVAILQERVMPRTRSDNAYVMGWGGSQRVVVPDTLLAAATPGELRFVLARSFAWIAANTGLHLALIQGAFIVVGTALAVFISDRIGFRRDDDPVSRLALLGAILGCVYLVALPLYNGYARNIEIATDEGGIALTADRANAVRLEVRHADQALEPVCPNWFARWYFGDRPSPGQRIAALQGRPNPCVKP
jgi:STE24 endopeptidase